jgi:anti-sigma regulatory factor (Ser/Thr protein kinase)
MGESETADILLTELLRRGFRGPSRRHRRPGPAARFPGDPSTTRRRRWCSRRPTTRLRCEGTARPPSRILGPGASACPRTTAPWSPPRHRRARGICSSCRPRAASSSAPSRPWPRTRRSGARAAPPSRALQRLEAQFSWKTSAFDVSRVCRRIARLLSESGFYADRAGEDECALALEEALVNSVEHGNLALDSSLRPDDPLQEDRYEAEREKRMADPAFGDKLVRLRLSIAIAGDEAKIVLEDEGKGFDTSKVDESPSGLDVSGKGFWLIKRPFDAAAYNSKGNKLTLVRRRPLGRDRVPNGGTMDFSDKELKVLLQALYRFRGEVSGASQSEQNKLGFVTSVIDKIEVKVGGPSRPSHPLRPRDGREPGGPCRPAGRARRRRKRRQTRRPTLTRPTPRLRLRMHRRPRRQIRNPRRSRRGPRRRRRRPARSKSGPARPSLRAILARRNDGYHES